MLFKSLTIEPIIIFPWCDYKLTPEARENYFRMIAEDLVGPRKYFGTHFTKELSFIEYEEALRVYSEVASKEGGKLRLRCCPPPD